MDFSQLSLVDTANKKRGTVNGGRKSGQSYTGLRFMRAEGKKGVISKFTASNALWSKLNLEKNGFFQLDSKDAQGNVVAVYLGCNSLEAEGKLRARMLRQREGVGRGKSFKSTNLEESLTNAGLLSEDFGKTYFQLEEAGSYEGVPMFKVVADPAKSAGSVAESSVEAEITPTATSEGAVEEYDANAAYTEEEEEEEEEI